MLPDMPHKKDIGIQEMSSEIGYPVKFQKIHKENKVQLINEYVYLESHYAIVPLI